MSELTVAMYLRVSSGGQSLETQNDACVRAATARNQRIARIYAEVQGGDARRRPELKRLLSDVRTGRVRTLYVYRLDRLSRGGIAPMFDIVRELDYWNVELVSIADGVHIGGTTRDIVLAVLAGAAQLELETTRARLADARARLAAEGRTWGRPGRITDQQRETIRLRREHFGETIRQIAVALKIPKSVVGRACSPFIVGTPNEGGHHPPSLRVPRGGVCPKNPNLVPLLGTAKKKEKMRKTRGRP